MNNIFPTLIGNSHLKTNIGTDIRTGHNSHAYIIEGDRGCGKRTVAELMAAAVSCEHRYDEKRPLPCGECNNCRKIKKGISPDIVRIASGDKSSIGIDAVRQIREGLYVTPNDSDIRTYIIESAERLTVQAQNALLLTIEEPPPFVLFLLLTEDSSKLLETIRSRAQRIRCESFSASQVADYLKKQPNGDDLYRKNPSKFAAAVSLSGGSIGKASELLRGSEDSNVLLKSRDTAAKLISYFSSSKASPLLKMIPTFARNAEEAKEIFFLVDNAVRDLCVLKKTDPENDAHLTFFTCRDDAEELVSDIPYKKLLHIHECVCDSIRQLDTNVPVKTAYTNLVFSCLKYRR